VGDEVLESLGVDPRSCLVTLNKVDRLDGVPPLPPAGRGAVVLSALTGYGMPELRSALRTRVLEQPGVEVLRFPPEGGEALQRALAEHTVVARRFTSHGIELVVRKR
jgi:50S ribosomal subunit-associated GTPase HflX